MLLFIWDLYQHYAALPMVANNHNFFISLSRSSIRVLLLLPSSSIGLPDIFSQNCSCLWNGENMTIKFVDNFLHIFLNFRKTFSFLFYSNASNTEGGGKRRKKGRTFPLVDFYQSINGHILKLKRTHISFFNGNFS